MCGTGCANQLSQNAPGLKLEFLGKCFGDSRSTFSLPDSENLNCLLLEASICYDLGVGE